MNKPKPLRVGGVPEHFNLPWHLAQENDAFAKSDLDVEYIDFPGGTGAMTRGLTDDEIDLALVLSEGAVANVLQGNAIKIVKVYVQSPLIWGIHVDADSDYHDIGDIRDRRYAISRRGSGSHLMAIVDAAERGWDTDKMEFVIVGGLAGARTALSNGEADAFLWERFMTQPYVDNGEFRRIGDRSVPWPAFVVAVREDVLAQRRDDIRRMLEIVDTECQELMENPKAVRLISTRYNLDPSETQAWFDHVRWHIGFDKPTEDLDRVIRYLKKVDIIENQDLKSDDVWTDLQTRNSKV